MQNSALKIPRRAVSKCGASHWQSARTHRRRRKPSSVAQDCITHTLSKRLHNGSAQISCHICRIRRYCWCDCAPRRYHDLCQGYTHIWPWSRVPARGQAVRPSDEHCLLPRALLRIGPPSAHRDLQACRLNIKGYDGMCIDVPG